MSINIEEVQYIADLARLELNSAEKELFTEQLQNILEYMDQLKEVDTQEVKPVDHVSGVGTYSRTDKVKDSLSSEKTFKNAPETEDGFFIVPRVVMD